MKALIDYLRVAVACLGFVFLDPKLDELLHWLPESLQWITGLVAVAVSAGVSWFIFRFLGPLSFVEFSWDDKLTKVKTAGPVLDVDSLAAGGQVFAVSVKRTTTTVVARFILRRLVRKGLKISVSSSQDELLMSLWSVAPLVAVHRDSLTVSLGKPDHDVNVVPFELGLEWDPIEVPEFSSKLRYRAVCQGPISSWIARRVIRIIPTVKEVRKVGGHV